MRPEHGWPFAAPQPIAATLSIPCNTSEQTAERMIESQALRLGAKPREGFEAQVSREPVGRLAHPVAPMIMRYTDNITRGRPAAAGRLVLPWEGG